MTKRKPLSILIASLFLATPAVAQNVNWQDPLTPVPAGRLDHRGRDHHRPDLHRHRLEGPVEAARVPRPRRRRAVEHPAARPQHDRPVVRLPRRELRPRGHVHEPPRRAVRRLEGPPVLGLDPARARHQHAHAAARRAERRPPQPLPAAEPRHLGAVQLRLPAQGPRRLLRVAAQLPVVLPRRRQPGEHRRPQGRGRGERHEPGQRLHRPADPGRLQDDQRHVRGRLRHVEVPVLVRVHVQQVRQRLRVDDVVEPVLQQRHRHDVPRAGQRLPAHRVQRLGPAVADGTRRCRAASRGTSWRAARTSPRSALNTGGVFGATNPAGEHVRRQGREHDRVDRADLGAVEGLGHEALRQLLRPRQQVHGGRVRSSTRRRPAGALLRHVDDRRRQRTPSPATTSSTAPRSGTSAPRASGGSCRATGWAPASIT